MLCERLFYAGVVAIVLSACGLPVSAQVAPKSEQQKIEALIAQIEGLEGATFVRNSRNYDAETAARFLREKWKARENKIPTAKDFVDKVASASSTTGEPYRIRLPDGTEKTSREYLLAELEALEEANRAATGRAADKAGGESAKAPPENGKDAPGEPIELTIRQRGMKAVPGMKDIQIGVGDVTEGRVALSVTGSAEKILLEPVLVRQGDVVNVAIGGRLYVVRVLDLANALIGQDFVTLSIAPADGTAEGSIAEIGVTLRAAPETEFRKVQETVKALSSLRITTLKQSVGKKGTGISAEIRPATGTPSRRVAAVVEALLDAGVDRIAIEVEAKSAGVQAGQKD